MTKDDKSDDEDKTKDDKSVNEHKTSEDKTQRVGDNEMQDVLGMEFLSIWEG